MDIKPDMEREYCKVFMESLGMTPTPDAIDQLLLAFVPALRIMIERGYDPNGATWREGGWRGILHEMRKKMSRLWFYSWIHGTFHADSGLDMINYGGFYVRLACSGMPWGSWGEPGSGGAGVSRIAQGKYDELTEEPGASDDTATA